MIESPLFMGQKNFDTALLSDLSAMGTGDTELRELLKMKRGLADPDTPVISAILEHDWPTWEIT